jgi:hypothetical protein
MRLAEGTYRVILGSGDSGYPNVTLDHVVVGASGATINYRYQGIRVSGSVAGPSGQPLTAAQVMAYPMVGGPTSAIGSTVGGRYSLLLPVGVYQFAAWSAGYADGIPRITWGDVAVASDTTIDISLTGFPVTATVTFSGGTPMLGAAVFASSISAQAMGRTGPSGTTTLYLPAGDYRIQAGPSSPNIVGSKTVDRSITGADAIGFDFSGRKWSMTIRTASDGAPLTGADASLHDGENGQAIAETDNLGRCEFFVQPGVAYYLNVSWWFDGGFRLATIPNLSSAADTTFDISVTP